MATLSVPGSSQATMFRSPMFLLRRRFFISSYFLLAQPSLPLVSPIMMTTNITARSLSRLVDIHHFTTTPIASTQDEARRLLPLHESTDRAMAVVADIQLEGRGTHGRTWERGTTTTTVPDGNLYMTVCVPMSKIPVTITLLPIKVAVMVAQSIQSVLTTGDADASCPTAHVHVKWPNDVLINDSKVSGTLIESEIVAEAGDTSAKSTTWLLIGIGINVASHPDVPGARAAASLAQFTTTATAVPSAFDIGKQLAEDLAAWVYTADSNTEASTREGALLSSWRSMARLQEEPGYTIRDTGETVTVQDIEADGRLRVRGKDGTIRHLVAEYLV